MTQVYSVPTDEDQNVWTFVTKQELWAWLKAENHYRPPKEKQTPVPNRAQRRRWSKVLKRIAA